MTPQRPGLSPLLLLVLLEQSAQSPNTLDVAHLLFNRCCDNRNKTQRHKSRKITAPG